MSLAGAILLELIRKSGVREYEEPGARVALIAAANELALGIIEMALPDYFKVAPGTAKTVKNSGGDAAITLASLASAAYRQAATLDLGANWARLWRIDTDFEIAATPTAGQTVNLHGSFSNATGAGAGNTTGSDAAYTGYSSNAAASVKQLTLLGAHVCTTQATATVQKQRGLVFAPTGRYLNLVVENASGAAFHSSDTNQVVTFTPLEELIQDAV